MRQSFLEPPVATIVILIVSAGISLASIIVNHLMVDMKKLQSINEDIEKYNEKMREAQRRGNSVELRRLRREEARVKMLASFSTKQRLRVTLVTILPFAAASFLLNSFYGAKPIAKLPFNTPVGAVLPFYIWYIFCYFTTYLPLTRIFGASLASAIPIRSSNRSGRR